MIRRKFIQLSATATAAAFIEPAISSTINIPQLVDCDHEDRVLVLIQLQGGNDGINTVIPINQYDTYASLRPDIKIANSGSNSFITLDTSLAPNDAIGLHPSLTGFQSMYNNDRLNIIQGVSYQDHNRSHFRSTDIWLTGSDGTQENASIEDGWMARYLTQKYPDPLPYPLGVQIGNKKNSRGFVSEHAHDISLNITGQDPSGFYNIVSGLGGEYVTNIPATDLGDNIAHIQDVDAFSNVYGEQISTAFNNGNNSTSYPDTDLGDQLKSVARLIDGGLETKIYVVRLSGFDTHNQQVNENDTHVGRHAVLLDELSSAVSIFFNDLEALGHGDRVLASTFSEFGRKVRQNGNFGTDHGQIAPLFLFGNGINSGVTGTNVNLTEATASNNYQLETSQYDYRQIFSSIVQDWFGISDDGVNLIFPDFYNSTPMSERYIDLIKNTHKVDPSCYSTVLTVPDYLTSESITLFPNPSSHYITLDFPREWSGTITISNFYGQVVSKKFYDSSVTELQIITSNFATGNYICAITNDSSVIVKKFIKI